MFRRPALLRDDVPVDGVADLVQCPEVEPVRVDSGGPSVLGGGLDVQAASLVPVAVS